MRQFDERCCSFFCTSRKTGEFRDFKCLEKLSLIMIFIYSWIDPLFDWPPPLPPQSFLPEIKVPLLHSTHDERCNIRAEIFVLYTAQLQTYL